jgi:rhodanese-related sulfurtransferase
MYGFKEIDIRGLRAMQSEGECFLIDVRTDAEVARGKIEGAIHIPLHMLPLKAAELRPDIPMVFYCQSGGRSAQACAFLAAKGFGSVFNLQGGILGWVRSGEALAA